MKTLLRLLVPSALLGFLLAGCEAPANVPRAASHRSAVPQSDWLTRREAQLTQMGLKPGEARSKAESEWRNLGNSTEGYTVYDSAAKQKAEQAKFEDDLAKRSR